MKSKQYPQLYSNYKSKYLKLYDGYPVSDFDDYVDYLYKKYSNTDFNFELTNKEKLSANIDDDDSQDDDVHVKRQSMVLQTPQKNISELQHRNSQNVNTFYIEKNNGMGLVLDLGITTAATNTSIDSMNKKYSAMSNYNIDDIEELKRKNKDNQKIVKECLKNSTYKYDIDEEREENPKRKK
jgi:hypothetical protein